MAPSRSTKSKYKRTPRPKDVSPQKEEESMSKTKRREMDNGILEVFPKLDEVPPGIASQFEEMIRCYLQTKSKTPTLDIFRVFKHVGQVYDDEGKLVCLCKASRDAKKEAAVYILDHPLSAHRSVSSELTGFGGATPTVFIRTEEASGCLVWFVENNNGVIGDHKHYQFSTLPEGISKLSIFHLRFGCADSHNRNTVTKIDAQKVHHLTPIDFYRILSSNQQVQVLFNHNVQSPKSQQIIITR